MDEKSDFCRLPPVSFLELRKRAEKWKTFPLNNDDEKVTIGRSPASDVFVASNKVSRTHAILMPDSKLASSWQLKDDQSRNGVFLNEVRLQPDEWKRLKSGDVVHLGPPDEADFSFKFVQTIKSRREEPPQLQRPPKMSKNDTLESGGGNSVRLVQMVVPSEEKHQEEVKTGELEKKLQVLEEQLKEKERVEVKLQEKLLKQEVELRESAQERERILRQKDQEELVLRQSLEKMLGEKERLLRESMANQQEERQKMHTETETKARCLEQELAEVQRLRERAKADVVGHFGELMETEFTCSICTELFIEAVTLTCAHTFCRLCITQWKKKKKECPVCRAKIKGSEARALAIDNFIEGMVKHLDPEVGERRQSLLRERAPGGSKTNQQVMTTRAPTLVQGQLSASMSVLLRPTTQSNLNPAGIRNPTVVVSRITNTNAATIVIPRPSNPMTHGQSGMPLLTGPFTGLVPRIGNLNQIRMPVPPVQPRMTVPPGQPRMTVPPGQTRMTVPPGQTRMTVPPGQTRMAAPNCPLAPNVMTRQKWAATAGNTNTVLGQRLPGTAVQRGQTPYVLVPRFQYTIPSGGVVTVTTSQGSVAVPVTHRYDGTSSAGPSGTRTQPTVTYAVTTGTISSVQVPSTSVVGSTAKPSTSAIVVSDSPVRDVSTIVISDEETNESSAGGNSGVYYGGYGRCFKCNRRGHWSNGCPFDT